MPDTVLNEDAEHLRLLSIFHYVDAVLAALFSCFPLIYVAMGAVMLVSPDSFGGRGQPPPPWVGAILIAMGSVFAIAGWAFAVCVFLAGRYLNERRRYTFCLVMAALNCMFVPFGTVLGVFAIVVLMRPSVRAMFGRPVPAAGPA